MSSPKEYAETPTGLRSGGARDGPEARRYRVLMELGHGGMGVAKLAMVRGPQGFVKLVVLKTLHPWLAADADAHRMFLAEARISARLVHPNIVQVYEVTELQGNPTIVMEYLEGQPLWSVLTDCPEPLPLPLRIYILCQALSGLQAAHDLDDYDGTPLGLIHRDISPQNIFLLYDGQVKVLDFGLAKVRGSEDSSQAGVTKGKLRYMAPEQLSDQEIDCRADLFSVGVMLWEAASERRFWDDRSDKEIMLQLHTSQLPEIELPQIPPRLQAICARALAPDREQRYANARELRLELEQYLVYCGEENTAEALSELLRRNYEQARQVTQQLIRTQVKVVSEVPRSEPETPAELAGAGRAGAGLDAWLTLGKRWAFGLASLGVSIAALVAALSLWGGRVAVGSPREGRSAAAQVSECAAEQKLCDGACVSVDRPEFGCGADDCMPCRNQNATPRCNAQHVCDIAVCYQAYGDCDKDAQNGCEVSVRLDPDHCGGCGHACPELPHAERGCGDTCTIWRCDAGYGDCNGDVSDGCEVALSRDAQSCGACGRACGTGETCKDGACRR